MVVSASSSNSAPPWTAGEGDVCFGSVAAISCCQCHMTSNDGAGSRRPRGYTVAMGSFPASWEMPDRLAQVPNPFGAAAQNVWRQCPVCLAFSAQLTGV